MGTPSKTAS